MASPDTMMVYDRVALAKRIKLNQVLIWYISLGKHCYRFLDINAYTVFRYVITMTHVCIYKPMHIHDGQLRWTVCMVRTVLPHFKWAKMRLKICGNKRICRNGPEFLEYVLRLLQHRLITAYLLLLEGVKRSISMCKCWPNRYKCIAYKYDFV